MAILNLKEIQNRIKGLFTEIKKAIEYSRASNEEKLKEMILSIFNEFFEKEGILFSRHIEYEESKGSILKIKGKKEAFYGFLIMDFKPYSYLSKSSQLKKAVKQIEERYFTPLSKKIRKEYGAIIFDGKYSVLVDYSPTKGKCIHTLRDFNENTLREWLVLLGGILKKAMGAEVLKKDLSIRTALAQEAITILYEELNHSLSHKRIKILFNEWEKTFRYIYGGVLTETKIDYDIKKVAEKILRTQREPQVGRFLFVLYTYYSFIVKLIASEIVCINHKIPFDSPLKSLIREPNLKESLRTIEDGSFFRELLGIKNYIEGGFFSWYLECWNAKIEGIVKKILNKLYEYNPQSLIDTSHNSRDILRDLYQEIVPKKIRHDLGEFYTPHWLAQLTIEEVNYKGSLNERVLDPGCGSGTFIIEIINKIKQNNLKKHGKNIILKHILENIIGFDVNPVAVLTARTNYLLAISDLLSESQEGSITLPIYLADSILTPTTEGEKALKEKVFKISTIEGIFHIPKEIVDKNLLSEILAIIEKHIEEDKNSQAVVKIIDKRYKLSEFSRRILLDLYKNLHRLHKENKNKIWTKLIQNSFAPLLFSEFDFIIGNPPWIKWDFLSEEYKQKLKDLYLNIYNLYSYKGMLAGMGFAHDDISIVFTYVSMDKYLKRGGRLGFVLKQTLYKSTAGKEFRKFCIEKGEIRVPLKMIKVHDLLKLKPFKNSSAETSIAILEKGNETTYPVSYFIWTLKEGKKIKESMSLEEIKRITERKEYDAYPDPSSEDPIDVWILVDKGKIPRRIKKTQNPYMVRHGVVNDLNSVFFVKILQAYKDELLIENMQIGKKKVKSIKTRIEKDLVYPVVKPRHVKKWTIKGNYYMIIPHKKHGTNNELELKTSYPKTYKYLHSFKGDLLKRSSRWFKGTNRPFYSLFGIGDYTFQPFKVLWSSIGYNPSFVVGGEIEDPYIGRKTIIPDNTISYIAFSSEDEAHYICSILNSSLIRSLFARRSTKSKWGVSITMVKKLPLPKYDPKKPHHRQLSELSRKAHKQAMNGGDPQDIEKKIDVIVEQIITY